MGGLGGSLLGGKPGKTSTTSTTNVNLKPWIEDDVQRIADEAYGLYQRPFEQYTGDRTADFSSDEMASFDIIRNMLGRGTGDMSEAQGIARNVAQRGLNGFDQSTLDQYMNPYIRNVMDVSKQRQLRDFDMERNRLSDQNAAVGAFGGSRTAFAERDLYDNFSRQMAEQEAMQLAQAYESGQNRAFQGTQMAGQSASDLANYARGLQQFDITNAGALSAQGGQQRGLAQADLDTAYGDYLNQQQYPYAQLETYSNFINPIAQYTSGQTNTSVQTQQAAEGSKLGKILGIASMVAAPFTGGASLGMMGGAGGAGGFMSSIGSFASQMSNPMTMMGNMGSRVMGGLNNAGFGRQMSNAAWNNYTPEWKEGGLVELPDSEKHMSGEGNDMVSRIDRFYDMIQEDKKRQKEEFSPEDDKQMLRDMMGENKQYFPHYASGGMVGGPQGLEFLDMLRMLKQYPEVSGKGLYEGLNALRNPTYNEAQPFETIAGNAGRVLSNTPAALGQGLASAMLAPGEAISNVFHSPRLTDEQALMPGIEKLADTPEKMQALREAQNRILAKMKAGQAAPSLANPIAQGVDPVMAEFEAAQEQRLAEFPNMPVAGGDAQALPNVFFSEGSNPTSGLGAQSGPGFISKDVEQKMSSPAEAMKQIPQEKKSEFNHALFQFGAALVGSDKDFFGALGDAGKAYTGTVMSREEAIKQAAKEAYEREMDQRKMGLEERRVQVAERGDMSNPYEAEFKRLRVKQMERELAEDPSATQLNKLILELSSVTPSNTPPSVIRQRAQELMGVTGGTTGLPTNPKGFQ